MEQETQFKAVLKKSVAMFNMLTGKKMTEREGRAFIEIFDMAEAYSSTVAPDPAETFDVLSQVTYEGQTDEENSERLRKMVENLPRFTDRRTELDKTVSATGRRWMDVSPAGIQIVQRQDVVPLDKCGCPVGRCTCTNEMLAEAARKHDIDPKFLNAMARQESSDNKTPIVGIVETENGQFKDGKRYTPPPIRNQSRDHIQGYDWQICVLSREKNPDDTYVIHYAEMPTQGELDEHFVKYHERTHYVHVNEWINWGWEGITDRYDRSESAAALTKPNAVVRTAPAPELRGRDVSQPPMSAAWEEPEKPWRIRYFSDVAQEVIFSYCTKRPTSAQMAHFHHAKCMAVSQARPKDVS